MWEVESVGGGSATMEVNGNVSEVEVGVDLKEMVLGFARDAGYGKFRFFIDEEEVLPQNAPSLSEAGRRYKITPYDVAG
jgi:hypothetical protein